MNRLILVLVASAVILSCSSAPETRMVFYHPDNNFTQLRQDEAGCRFQVNQAMLNYRIPSGDIAGGLARLRSYDYADSLMRDCMVSKGYDARIEEVPVARR